MSRICRGLFLLLVAGSGLGCFGEAKPPSGMVSGQVTLEGTPVTSGSVVFYSTELGIGSQASINPDGTYTLPNKLQVGEYAISVQGLEPVPGEPPPEPTKVPQKYWQATTSDLTITIVPGNTTYDISLSQ